MYYSYYSSFNFLSITPIEPQYTIVGSMFFSVILHLLYCVRHVAVSKEPVQQQSRLVLVPGIEHVFRNFTWL